MGLGGAMVRTWSGPGGSSHKGPLTSAHAYSQHWTGQTGSRRHRDGLSHRVLRGIEAMRVEVPQAVLCTAFSRLFLLSNAGPQRPRPSERLIVEIIQFFVDLLSDPRAAIAGWIVALGPLWVYSPLFLIVFVETGLVFFPFLPGDSLLFAAGVFSADGGGLNIWATLFVFYAAAILGNTSNYWIARFFGARIIDSGKVKALTPERMSKLDHFFAKYGGLTIIITRFMPFFRTFAPFIAGTGHMNFAKFTLFNVIGGVAWVTSFVLVGYFFGGIAFVQEHFEVIVLGIVAVSVAPAIIGAAKAALNAHKKKRSQAE